MQATAALSSKFQLYLPKAVCEQQQWRAGRELAFIPKGKGVLLMPVRERDQLAGIVKGARKGGFPGLKEMLLAEEGRTDQLVPRRSHERG